MESFSVAVSTASKFADRFTGLIPADGNPALRAGYFDFYAYRVIRYGKRDAVTPFNYCNSACGKTFARACGIKILIPVKPVRVNMVQGQAAVQPVFVDNRIGWAGYVFFNAQGPGYSLYKTGFARAQTA
jgi:hypothetical protein